MRGRVPARFAIAVVALAVVGAACSDGDVVDSSTAAPSTTTTTTTPSTTTSTEPVDATAFVPTLSPWTGNMAMLTVPLSPVHGSYQAAAAGDGASRRCATDYIDRFLIDLGIPPDGTFCAEG